MKKKIVMGGADSYTLTLPKMCINSVDQSHRAS